MGKPGNSGLGRIINAAKYSYRGLKAAWINEAAFRQESVLALLMAPAAFFIAQDGVELALLLGCLFLTLIVELLNSAIEAVVDRIGDEYNELAGRAKDLGSAAVLLCLLLTLLVWAVLIFDEFLFTPTQ